MHNGSNMIACRRCRVTCLRSLLPEADYPGGMAA